MKIVVKRRGKLQAGPGVNIAKAKGNTLVRTRASNQSPSAGSEGAAIDVIGSDGKLNKVPKHSTWATPTTYPTEVRVVHVASGVYMALSSPSGLPGIRLVGAHTLSIVESDLTQDMSIREIDVCDAGVTKKMLVIASAPYV
jgi:hypothetical protein